jgi:hypothetical protein
MPSLLDPDILYPGYLIALPGDFRDLIDDRTSWFECHVIKEKKLLMKVPSWWLDLNTDLDKVQKWAHAESKEYIYDTMVEAKNRHNAIINEGDEAKKFKHYLLSFKDHVVLDPSVTYLLSGKMNKCEIDIVPIKSFPLADHPDESKRDNSASKVQHYVIFTVARTDLGHKLKGEVKMDGAKVPDASKKAQNMDSGF